MSLCGGATTAPTSHIFPTNQQPLNKSDPALDAFEIRQKLLLTKLLISSEIDPERWIDVLWPLIRDVAYSVQPDVRHNKDEMDVLKYIHVKTMVTDAGSPNARLVFGMLDKMLKY